MGKDLRQRYIKDFLKLGRTGKSYYIFGAPEDMKGPYGTPKEAEAVYKSIVDNFQEYEIIDRKVLKKGS